MYSENCVTLTRYGGTGRWDCTPSRENYTTRLRRCTNMRKISIHAVDDKGQKPPYVRCGETAPKCLKRLVTPRWPEDLTGRRKGCDKCGEPKRCMKNAWKGCLNPRSSRVDSFTNRIHNCGRSGYEPVRSRPARWSFGDVMGADWSGCCKQPQRRTSAGTACTISRERAEQQWA